MPGQKIQRTKRTSVPLTASGGRIVVTVSGYDPSNPIIPEELTAEEYSRIRDLIGAQNTFCVLCGEIFPQFLNSTHYFTCPFMEIGE